MHRTLLSLLLLAGTPACATTRADARPAGEPAARPFSMRMYQVVILRRGPAWSAEQTAATQAIGAGHMEHLRRQGAAGTLVLAGPFEVAAGDPGAATAAAGLCIYAVETAAEARALAGEDPAVQAGRFTVEVLPWYGPAGLSYDGKAAVTAGPR